MEINLTGEENNMKLYEIKTKGNGTHYLQAKNNVEVMKLANFLKNLDIERIIDEKGKVVVHNNFND